LTWLLALTLSQYMFCFCSFCRTVLV